MLADLQQFKCLTVNVAERLFGSDSKNFLSLPALFDCGPSVASGMWDEGRDWKDGRQRKSLRVCPDTLGRITKFSKHEPN